MNIKVFLINQQLKIKGGILMSNLGAYQQMTTLSKKVGGPRNFILLTMIAGATIYKLSELSVTKCIKVVKSHRASQSATSEFQDRIFSVTSFGQSNEGVNFPVGCQYRVLEKDGDAVLIEKIGDENNPYFVSANFLHTISDFQE